jgi:hypothetical protein
LTLDERSRRFPDLIPSVICLTRSVTSATHVSVFLSVFKNAFYALGVVKGAGRERQDNACFSIRYYFRNAADVADNRDASCCHRLNSGHAVDIGPGRKNKKMRRSLNCLESS